jgi:hypothetical protein
MPALRFISLSAVALLCSCDRFYGPTITNRFGTDVEVTVVYSNGEMQTVVWPACRTSFIGRQEVQVDRVTFKKDSELLREFASEEIRAMVEKELSDPGYAAWTVGPNGVSLVTSESKCVNSGFLESAPTH